MAKVQKKSIADLVSKRKSSKPSPEEIDRITGDIHETTSAEKPKASPKEKPTIKRSKRITAKSAPAPVESGVTKRISVDTPLELFLELQRAATLSGKSKKDFILDLLLEKFYGTR